MTPGFDDFLDQLRTQLTDAAAAETAAKAARERVQTAPQGAGAGRFWHWRPRMAFVAGVLVPAAVVLAVVTTSVLTADELHPSSTASRLAGGQSAGPTPAFVLPQTSAPATPGALPDVRQFAYVPAAVAADSAFDVWVVGASVAVDGPDRPAHASSLVLHWDGATWRQTPSPDIGPLSAVSTAASGDAWALSSVNNALLHWDGRQWSAATSGLPDGCVLTGLTAVAANDVWVVGSHLGEPLAMHWNGSSWQTTDLPGSSGAGGTLTSIAASSSADVWVVGTSSAGQRLAFRWDGAQWSAVQSDEQSIPGGGNVVAVSPEDVWISSDVLLHWDGTGWSDVSNVLGAFTGSSAVVSSSDIWMCAPARGGVVHWDGTSWRATSPAEMGVPAGDNAAIESVTAVSGNDVWAVGTIGHLGELTARPLIVHWNGSGWRVVVDAAQAN